MLKAIHAQENIWRGFRCVGLRMAFPCLRRECYRTLSHRRLDRSQPVIVSV
jgi:hypothetical protein